MGVKGGHSQGESPFQGLYVVAKFYYSKAPDGGAKLISRTLGKFGIIDRASPKAAEVGNQEVWVSKIVSEISPGRNHGAFLLSPISRVEDPDNQLLKLIPGFYSVDMVGKVAVLTPKTDNSSYWVLSQSTRRIFRKHHAVIVPIDFKEAAGGPNVCPG